MEIEKSKVLIQFLVIFRQSGDVLFFFYARRLRGYTATLSFNETSIRVAKKGKIFYPDVPKVGMVFLFFFLLIIENNFRYFTTAGISLTSAE